MKFLNDKLKFKTPSIKAVIFDMDGVLVDSEHWWQKWEKKFFKRLLGEWNQSDLLKIMGRSLKDIHSILQKNFGLLMAWPEFKKKYNKQAEHIYKNQANLMPQVRQTIIALKAKGLKIALASSSFKLWIKMMIQRFKLKKYFDVMVSAEEVGSRGKPAPDIYLYTARKLKVKPSQCLVIEDSKNGILAAKAAGMIVFGYQTKFNRRQDLREADGVIKDLNEIVNDHHHQLRRF